MRWIGDRESENIEDRRGSGMPMAVGGIGGIEVRVAGRTRGDQVRGHSRRAPAPGGLEGTDHGHQGGPCLAHRCAGFGLESCSHRRVVALLPLLMRGMIEYVELEVEGRTAAGK